MQPEQLIDAVALVLRPLVIRVTDLESAKDAHIAAMHQELTQLRERVAVLEVRAPVPGPAGADGANGKDGRDGSDGRSVDFVGVYDGTRTYQRGQIVTHGGSLWHCNTDTTAKPDTDDGAKAWTLCVKRGRDGRDLRDVIPAVRQVK